jgi:hypothetical protein
MLAPKPSLPMAAWLYRIGLSQFHEHLRSSGFECVSDLVETRATEATLKQIGVEPAAARRHMLNMMPDGVPLARDATAARATRAGPRRTASTPAQQGGPRKTPPAQHIDDTQRGPAPSVTVRDAHRRLVAARASSPPAASSQRPTSARAGVVKLACPTCGFGFSRDTGDRNDMRKGCPKCSKPIPRRAYDAATPARPAAVAAATPGRLPVTRIVSPARSAGALMATLSDAISGKRPARRGASKERPNLGRPRTAAVDRRVISDCHFAVQLNHFMPVFLSYSVAVFF